MSPLALMKYATHVFSGNLRVSEQKSCIGLDMVCSMSCLLAHISVMTPSKLRQMLGPNGHIGSVPLDCLHNLLRVDVMRPNCSRPMTRPNYCHTKR